MDKNLKMYLKYLKDMKKLQAKDNYFTNSMQFLGSSMHLATLHFSLFIANEIKPFLVFFQADRPIAVLLFEKLKELVSSLMDRFVQSEILKSNNSVKK